jgi:hypothetical protein
MFCYNKGSSTTQRAIEIAPHGRSAAAPTEVGFVADGPASVTSSRLSLSGYTAGCLLSLPAAVYYKIAEPQG